MKSTKNSGKLLVTCIALISVVASLKANYYKNDFFPIGLTGINSSGWSCPYSNADIPNPWVWQENEPADPNGEDSLIYDLGVNCIGCEDVYRHYLVSFDPETEDEDTYLHKVCLPSLKDDDTTNNVYLISAGLTKRIFRLCYLIT